VQTSDFLGGAIGSFSGTLAHGGLPNKPLEWAGAIGGAAATGNAFRNSNPLNLLKSGIENSTPSAAGFIDLPTVNYSDVSAGIYASWWGQTGTFLNPVARAVAFQGFYNGIIDNVSNFFAGDSPEVNWYRGSDGSYFPLTHPQFVGGEGPAIGAGRLGAARSSYQKMKYLKELAKSGKSPKWMKQWLTKGRVPPGYQVHHKVPLFRGGADLPRNMKLIDIKMHRTFHRLFGYRLR
jgi:hypothetical protein